MECEERRVSPMDLSFGTRSNTTSSSPDVGLVSNYGEDSQKGIKRSVWKKGNETRNTACGDIFGWPAGMLGKERRCCMSIVSTGDQQDGKGWAPNIILVVTLTTRAR